MGRDDILQATQLANEFRGPRFDPRAPAFDVLALIEAQDLPVLVRPMKNLWGATITLDDGTAGVMINSRIPRPVQRFTLAHELGHYLLGHQNMFDDSVCFRVPKGATRQRPEELAADTFASTLLAPPHAITELLTHRGVSPVEAREPLAIYQVALRLGISFAAAHHAFRGANVLDWGMVKRNLNDPSLLRALKQHVSGGLLEDSRGDAWILTDADDGMSIEGGPTDVYALNLDEAATAGYVWELVSNPSVQILSDTRATQDALGALATRQFTFMLPTPGCHDISLRYGRPWEDQEARLWRVTVTNWGKEQGGFPRKQREARLAGA